VCDFKHLENLEKIRRTNSLIPSSLPVDNNNTDFVTSSVSKSSKNIRRNNSPNPSSLPVDNKHTDSVTSSVGKYSKNHKGSNMWCYYCDKNNHNTADWRAIAKFK
jgi:hypothetical protein